MKAQVRAGLRALGLSCALWASFASPVSAQTSTSSPQSDFYFGPERVLAFAEHLQRQGDFRRAITEYQRYLFSGETEHRSRALYQMGLSFYKLNEPVHAAPHFLEASRVADTPLLRDSAGLAYAASLLAGETYAAFFDVAATTRFDDPALQVRLTDMVALAHIRRGEWQLAESVLAASASVQARNQVDVTASSMSVLVTRGQNLPRKSPALAGVLSSLVPGAGKVYTNRLEDGLYSLLLVGGASRLAYEGFRNDGKSSTKGWVFGTLGAALYAGNIYGSVVAVRLYNASHKEALQHDIQAEISFTTRM
jgi:tetratricopeptide (TPR) repeat protein